MEPFTITNFYDYCLYSSINRKNSIKLSSFWSDNNRAECLGYKLNKQFESLLRSFSYNEKINFNSFSNYEWEEEFIEKLIHITDDKEINCYMSSYDEFWELLNNSNIKAIACSYFLNPNTQINGLVYRANGNVFYKQPFYFYDERRILEKNINRYIETVEYPLPLIEQD